MSMNQHILEQIIEIGRFMDAKGWAPATSGNYSIKIDHFHIAITASGKQKGELTLSDILVVDFQGVAPDGRNPSAEVLLHTAIYRFYPQVNAVLHTHSVASVTLSRLMSNAKSVRFSGYEMLKAFPGISTHDTCIEVPVFDNSQDMKALATEITSVLPDYPETSALIIRGHGVYGWGHNIAEARRVIETVEFLLECELKQLSIVR